MLAKLITKSLRPLGLILIFLFAIFCMTGSYFLRDIGLIESFIKYADSFESRFYDFRMLKQLDNAPKSDEVILVNIDDPSLQKLGFWPIPRTIHAKMLDKLHAFGAKVVALDILFPEKSPPFGKLDPDQVLADSIKKFQKDGRYVFLGYTFTDYEEDALPETPIEMSYNQLTVSKKFGNFTPQKINRYNFPIQELVSAEVGFGSIESKEDSDGVFRKYQLLTNVNEEYHGSLAFNSFKAYTGKTVDIKIFDDNTGLLKLDDKEIAISPSGEMKIRYVGTYDKFESISLYDLLQTNDSDEKMKTTFNNKIVFVGSSAMGAHDLRPSPVDSKMPGVFSHMNLVNMLIKKHLYKDLNDSLKISLCMLIIGMILFYFVQNYGNPFLDALVVILIIGTALIADHNYFLPNGYELKLFYCFFCFIASYSWNTFLKFSESNKEKKQIRGTFARYVAPTIVDEMLKDPEKLHVGGTKMDITCLFSDVRDFTKISENLTATELAQSLNMYMGQMTDIVFDTKGTLDKYIGDAIVAIWGAPLEIGNHAQYAVEGAIKMIDVLPSINEEFKKLNRPVFNVGIGLNSGECSVGNMGSNRIFSYTALGDNMNLGARLEGLCKYYGTQILISQMTLDRLDLTNIKVRTIDKVIVKGKTTAVPIYEVLHPHHWLTKDPESYASYLKASELFQSKDFAGALEIFKKLLSVNEEDKACKRFSEVCKKYIEDPELVTENFDVTTMTEK